MEAASGGLQSSALVLLLLQLALILAVARALAELMRRIGQPQVIGELAAGLLLGPTVGGHFAPEIFGAVFPASGLELLELVSWLGMLLLLLLTGIETDVRAVRSLGRASLSASILGMVIPFASGLALGWLLPDAFLTDPASRPVFAGFLATAMAISALPVIAKILIDLDLIRRNVGLVVLSAAVVDDVTGWLLLSLIAGVATGGGVSAASFGLTALGLALFVVATRWVAYPLFSHAVRVVNGSFHVQGADLTLVLAFTFVVASVTEAMGVHALLGAFAAGLVVRQTPRLRLASLETLETFVLSGLSPIFFAFVGLRVDLWTLTGWAMPAVVLGVAIAGKVVGCYAGGRIGRLDHWESLALGFGMNARGAMGLVVALVGLSLGLLTDEVYATIVLVAVATSFMAPLLLRWAAPRLPLHEEERRRIADDAAETLLPTTPLRILVPTAGGENAMGAMRLAAPLVRHPQAELTALYVAREASGRPRRLRRGEIPAGTGIEQHLEQAAALVSSGRFVPRRLSAPDVAAAVLHEAARDYDLLFLGAAHEHALDDPLARTIVAASPVPVVIVKRGAGAATATYGRILVPLDGSLFSRYAAELAVAYAAAVGTSVDVLHVLESGDPPAALQLPRMRRPDAHDEAALAEMEAEIERQLESLASTRRVRVSARVVAHSDAADLIVSESRSGRYDLLVIGAERRLLGRPSLFGRGTAEIVERAGCATAVVIPAVS